MTLKTFQFSWCCNFCFTWDGWRWVNEPFLFLYYLMVESSLRELLFERRTTKKPFERFSYLIVLIFAQRTSFRWQKRQSTHLEKMTTTSMWMLWLTAICKCPSLLSIVCSMSIQPSSRTVTGEMCRVNWKTHWSITTRMDRETLTLWLVSKFITEYAQSP